MLSSTYSLTLTLILTTDWGETTREEVIAKAADPYFVYFASKILAEKAVWEFAKEHPELDVATSKHAAPTARTSWTLT